MIDSTVLEEFLRTIFEPDDLVELRCITTWQANGHKRSERPLRYWWPIQSICDRIDDLRRLNSGQAAANIYFGVCPRPADGCGKSSEIRIVRVLWADVDLVDCAELRRRLADSPLPPPTMMVNSGHGVHLYWKLAEPVAVEQPEHHGRVTNVLKNIQAAIGGDSTHDLARLLRLPGFDNVKNARNGHEPHRCELIELDVTRRYLISDFEDVYNGLNPTPPSDVQIQTIGQIIEREYGRAKSSDRSRQDFHVCRKLVQMGVDREKAWTVLSTKSKFAERDRSYFDLTWSKAASAPTQNATKQPSIPKSIEVLGTDRYSGAILIWSTPQQLLWRIARPTELTEAKLVQIAGHENLDPGTPIIEYQRRIANASRSLIFKDDDGLGAGIWSPNQTDVVFISDSRAGRLGVDATSETLELAEISAPLIDGRLIEFGQSGPDINAIAAELGTVDPRRSFSELVEVLQPWEFASAEQREMMAALIIAAPLQALLRPRPNVWISGPSNCGKSAFREQFKRLYPYATLLGNETTEAAVRQLIGRSSLPIFMDEFEQWPHRQRIIKLLRSSTTGDKVFKGTVSGRPISFGLNHIAFVASIDVNLKHEADRNRFLIFQLGKPAAIALADENSSRVLGSSLTAGAIKVLPRVRQLLAMILQSDSVRSGGRGAELLAVPVAVQAAMLGSSDEHTLELLNTHLTDRQPCTDESSEPDHEELLTAILSFVLRSVDGESTAPVGDVLDRDNWKVELNNIGIKCVDGSVFLAPDLVVRRVLRGTQYAERSIADILARAPGARRIRLRVCGTPHRGVLIPFASLPSCDEADYSSQE